MFEITLIKKTFTPVAHPRGAFIDPRESSSLIFICGSLMDPAFTATIIGRTPATCPALARGLARTSAEIGGKQIQFLTPSPGALTQGLALLGLTQPEIQKLDAFEQTPQLRRKINLDGASYEKLLIGNIELNGNTYIKND